MASFFLSIFFSFVKSDNFLDYMMTQRYITVTISVLTVIPAYLLCRRFFSNKYALIGASLFIFDPRIITNSVMGLTESLFVLLGITSFFLFLGNNRSVYASFGVLALMAMIRYEALLLIVPFSIMYFVRFRGEKTNVLKYTLCITIFVLVLLPMAYVRIETTGQDGLTSNLFAGQQYITKHVVQGIPDDDDPISGTDYQNKSVFFMITAVVNLAKYILWLMIPILIFFVPIGIFLIIKNRGFAILNHKVYSVILFSIVILIPAFYIYGRGIQDTRYLFMILPIAYLVSLYAVKKLDIHFSRKKTVLVLLVCSIIFVSAASLEYQKIDYQHEREAFVVAQEIVKVANGINIYSENKYIKTAEIAEKWPELPKPNFSGHVSLDTVKIPVTDYKSLEQFISDSKLKGLTHLVVDDADNSIFLSAIFKNDKKYPYLNKIYDSSDYNMHYHVKIYEIDYATFEKIRSTN